MLSDYYKEAKCLLGAAMNIREWASNSEQFMDLLPPEDRIVNCGQGTGHKLEYGER